MKTEKKDYRWRTITTPIPVKSPILVLNSEPAMTQLTEAQLPNIPGLHPYPNFAVHKNIRDTTIRQFETEIYIVAAASKSISPTKATNH